MANDADDIFRYRKGLMSDRERHAFEKRALHDPFLADALEGAEDITPGDFQSDVDQITGQITHRSTRTWPVSVRVAAGIIGLAVVGGAFYLLQPEPPAQFTTEVSADSAYMAERINTAEVRKPDSLIAMAKESTPAPEPKSSGDLGISRREKASTVDATGNGSQPAAKDLAGSKDEGKAIEEEKTVALQLDRSAAIETRSEMKKSEAKPAVQLAPMFLIQGLVTAASDGSPLPGVHVKVKGSSEGTYTDANGRYKLNTHIEKPELSYSFVGYQVAEASPISSQTVNVTLAEEVAQLSEVVIAGKAIRDENEELRQPVVKMAAPQGGMKAYNKYLEASLRYPKEALDKKIKGKVTVQFTVTTQGELTDFNVVKGLGYGCDEEVIRLVKEGPAWTPTTEDDVAVESEVKVRMKFDPEKARN
ncbi:MAG TPA: TonB family protein [Cyclobacteriaceae bacterium]|nr:TonB family protein [Cyclobacteriaceae bacterium]